MKSILFSSPIYGYHRKEHQFFKIYMYNPYLIRKANNLLMNGVILSRVFQTFESHVPYILQFFIDYNLYGMSLLDVPDSAIQQRTEAGEDGSLQKMSTSEYEVDILAGDILNRHTMEQEKRSEYANPGIASIWNDEKARRALLAMEQPEALSLSQGGKVEIVTESDRFYRSVLAAKLAEGKGTNRSVEGDERRLKPPVSFYPSEAADDERLLDASCVQDLKHFSQYSVNLSNTVYDFDASQVDEDRIVSMSQNPDATFAEEDHQLLDNMRELEENEGHDLEGDSLLAPLTQQTERKIASTGGSGLSLSQSSNRRLNASLSGDLEMLSLMGDEKKDDDGTQVQHKFDETLDSDDDFLLDYTMKMDVNRDTDLLNDSDDDILNSSAIPQLDGTDDGEFPMLRSKRTNQNRNPPVVHCNGVKMNGHDEPTVKRLKHVLVAKLTNGFEIEKETPTNGVHEEKSVTRQRKKIKLDLPNGSECVPNGLTNGGHGDSELKQRPKSSILKTDPPVPKLKELKVK